MREPTDTDLLPLSKPQNGLFCITDTQNNSGLQIFRYKVHIWSQIQHVWLKGIVDLWADSDTFEEAK